MISRRDKFELIKELHRDFERFLEEEPWRMKVVELLEEEHVHVFLAADDTSRTANNVNLLSPSPEEPFDAGLTLEDIFPGRKAKVGATVN